MKINDGEILRHKKTGKPYLVIAHNHLCTLVIDLQMPSDPLPLFAILVRDYPKYARDIEMNCYTVTRYSYWMDPRNIFTLAPKIRLR